jgi:hypothetical protein
MKAILLATVSEFFKQRAGMFFVLIAVIFGFLSGAEHHALAIFFLTDRFGMLYILILWTLYAFLCLHFLLNLWKQPAYHFVYQTRLWSVQKRFFRFGLIALGFLQPLIYYGLCIMAVAYQDHLLKRVWPVFVFYLILILAVAAGTEWRIRNPRLFVSNRRRVGKWHVRRPLSWIYWSLEWLVREKGVTLLICKTGSALVFVCTLLYYQTDTYDLRLPAICLSLAYLLNTGLSYELFQWENVVWLWNRSLPLSIQQRFGRMLLIHALIILPETLICFRYHTLTMAEIIQLYGLGLSVLLLFHTRLYRKNGLLEDSIQPVLIGFVVLTLLVLYKIPVLLIAVSGFLYSWFVFQKWYAGKQEQSK